MTDRKSCAIRLLLVAVLTTMAGCSGGGDDMQSMTQADAKSRVGRDAQVIREAAGAGEFSQANANVTPCEGGRGELSETDDIFYVQGIYQLLIPRTGHMEALSRARAALEGAGYTIAKERSLERGGGEFSGSTTDGYQAVLSSGEDEALSLLVSSPCYRTPRG